MNKEEKLKNAVSALFNVDPHPQNDGQVDSMSDFLGAISTDRSVTVFERVETPEQRKAALRELDPFKVKQNARLNE